MKPFHHVVLANDVLLACKYACQHSREDQLYLAAALAEEHSYLYGVDWSRFFEDVGLDKKWLEVYRQNLVM